MVLRVILSDKYTCCWLFIPKVYVNNWLTNRECARDVAASKSWLLIITRKKKKHSPLHKLIASAGSGSCWISCGWYSPGWLKSCCWVHDNHEKCVHDYSVEDCWWWPCVLSPSVWLAECATALSEGSSHGSWTLDNPGTRRVITYPLTNIWGDQPGHTFPAPGGRCSWSGRAWPCSRCALLMSLARRLGMGQALVSKNSLSTTSSRVERKSFRPFNHSLGSWTIL